MKRFLLLSGLALACVLSGTGRVSAQELPAIALTLPPLPHADTVVLQAKAPAPKSIPAGLPGGPERRFIPQSQLTLPAKPVIAQAANAPELDAVALDQDNTPVVPPELPLSTDDPHSSLHDLLPLPGEIQPVSETSGDLPDPEALPSSTPIAAESASLLPTSPESTESTPAPAGPDAGDVPSTDLAPQPETAPNSAPAPTRGPIFRVPGPEAFAVARQRGFRFTPAQGMGRRDGNHTVASQVPNVLTSEVHGTRMMQMRPSPLWTTPYIENTFYMFCDGNYNAVKLQPGWKIRGIQLKGPDWQWLVCPKSGANTASFSIKIRSWKLPDAPAQGTVVTLTGLTLEGPPGATDWKAAFPDLTQSAPAVANKR